MINFVTQERVFTHKSIHFLQWAFCMIWSHFIKYAPIMPPKQSEVTPKSTENRGFNQIKNAQQNTTIFFNPDKNVLGLGALY